MPKQELRKDIFGVIPEIGDLIAFNPAKYKGLVIGKCTGFSKSGLPEVEVDTDNYIGQTNMTGYYTPKTGFVVHKITL